MKHLSSLLVFVFTSKRIGQGHCHRNFIAKQNVKYFLFSLFCDISGEKHIVKLLHFPNITASEQKRLLKMSGTDSASSDDEQERDEPNATDGVRKTQRKKSSKRRSLDLQRKISLSKLKEEQKEKELNDSHNNHVAKSDSTTTQTVTTSSVPIKHVKHRLARNGKISGGYEQFSMSLLTVPMPKDYGEPSSGEDLSSEWDSDSVADNNSKTNGAANKESKVRISPIINHYVIT